MSRWTSRESGAPASYSGRRRVFTIEFFVPQRRTSIFCECDAQSEEEAHEIARAMLGRMGLSGKAVPAIH